MILLMKKVLFIDRDGTLIIEPQPDFQVDSLGKLEFYPQVFRYLSRIAKELDYELVMVTNQDGLGTSSFPDRSFDNFVINILSALSADSFFDKKPSINTNINIIDEYKVSAA